MIKIDNSNETQKQEEIVPEKKEPPIPILLSVKCSNKKCGLENKYQPGIKTLKCGECEKTIKIK